MHITLETDYAVRIVDYLAGLSEIRDAGAISENTGVSLRFSLKILRALAEKGIVRSYKGSKGGYILAREPGEITLLEVIEATEGRYKFSRCLDSGFPCSNTCRNACKFYAVYDEISEMVRDRLSTVTFMSRE